MAIARSPSKLAATSGSDTAAWFVALNVLTVMVVFHHRTSLISLDGGMVKTKCRLTFQSGIAFIACLVTTITFAIQATVGLWQALKR